MVKDLVADETVNVNLQDFTNKTPFCAAVCAQHVDVVEYLLSVPRCNPNLFQVNDRTPYIEALDLPDGDAKVAILHALEAHPRVHTGLREAAEELRSGGAASDFADDADADADADADDADGDADADGD